MHIPHYDLAQTSAVAFDLSSFGKLKLTGKDRTTFLQNFTTNDVVKPGIGSGCETFLTTAQARIVSWLRVTLRTDDLYVNMEPGLLSKVVTHLEKFIIGEEVQLEDRTEADFLWLLTGPKVPEIMQTFGIPFSNWTLWQNAEVAWGQVKLSMQRCDFLGKPGAFVWGQRERVQVASAFLHGLQIMLLSTSDPLWNTLRLEAGTPAYGFDIDETYLPQEANRTEQAISFTKGCYIGQETVARIRAYGHVNRKLIRLKFEGEVQDACEWSGAVLKVNDKEVGKLKTVAYSPQYGAWIAFGLVRKEHLEPGTVLTALRTGSNLTVQVIVTT